MAIWVYPRPRGGAVDASPISWVFDGLSPPTRGSLDSNPTSMASSRSIPAHAGEPPTTAAWLFRSRVYPRPRGGALVVTQRTRAVIGLSPPTRGSLELDKRGGEDKWSIPAHAGEPSRTRSTHGPLGVYPRPRGGASSQVTLSFSPRGLSPPTRGSQLFPQQYPVSGGSIPAHAGEPSRRHRPSAGPSVYPRPRGGAGTSMPRSLKALGLSPPTRGSLVVVAHRTCPPGSIPAHAGEPHLPQRWSRGPVVYPRPRGGAPATYADTSCISGLSPPTRGSQHGPAHGRHILRSIPAHAGEP